MPAWMRHRLVYTRLRWPLLLTLYPGFLYTGKPEYKDTLVHTTYMYIGQELDQCAFLVPRFAYSTFS